MLATKTKHQTPKRHSLTWYVNKQEHEGYYSEECMEYWQAFY